MSKKHFIAIAAEIKEQRDNVNMRITAHPELQIALDTINITADRLCDVFSAENPNFDRNRFLTACGIK